jgi:hypothetical protein
VRQWICRIVVIVIAFVSLNATAQKPSRVVADAEERKVCGLDIAAQQGMLAELTPVISAFSAERANDARYVACPSKLTLRYKSLS